MQLRVFVLWWSFLLAIPCFADTVTDRSHQPPALVLGKQSDMIRKQIKKWLPITTELGSQIGKLGEVKVFTTPDEVRKDILNDQIDILFETVFQFSVFDPENRMKLMLNVWKKGVEGYSGCVFRLKEAQPIAIGQIRVVGFEDPFSTSSFALPIYSLLSSIKLENLHFSDLSRLSKKQKQSKLKILKQLRDSNQTNYVFTGSDETTLHWLIRGYIELGGLPCKYKKDPKLEIVSESPMVPRLIFAVHRSLDEGERQQLVNYLLNMDLSTKSIKKPTKATKILELNESQKALLDQIQPKMQKIWTKISNDLERSRR